MSIVAISFSVWRRRPRPRSLSLLRRSLRSLQRIHRRRTRKSASLSWWLFRLRNNEVATLGPWNAALDHQQIFILIHTKNPQVALGHAGIAHVSRHPHPLKHT